MKMVRTTNLTKKYGEKLALDHINLEVEEHTICGVLGPNGAGKTTLFSLLMGFVPRTDGTVVIDEKPVKFRHPSPDVRFLQEVPEFYDYMTAIEYLTLIADLNRINRKAVGEMLKMVHLYEFKDQKISTYSLEMKKRLGIASTVLPNPKVLILDEPLASLDPIRRNEIVELMKDLKQYVTILFSTHSLTDVEKICDYIIVLEEGNLVMNGSIQELSKKYLSDVLEIQFYREEDLIKFKKQYHIPNQTSFDMNNNNYTIRFKSPNLLELEDEILNVIAKQQIKIINFSLKHPTLEEIFESEVLKK